MDPISFRPPDVAQPPNVYIQCILTKLASERALRPPVRLRWLMLLTCPYLYINAIVDSPFP